MGLPVHCAIVIAKAGEADDNTAKVNRNFFMNNFLPE